MVNEQTDVNSEDTSSTSSDVNEQNSSTVEQDVNQTTEVADEAAAEVTEESSTEVTAEGTAEEKTVVEEEKVADEAALPLDKPEDAKLPFGKHPRFQELIQEKNAAKQEYEQAKPLIDQARVTNEFLRDNQIQPQEYQSALQYLMLLRNDPAKAFEMLKPTYDQLALLAGEKLPADLQAKVAAGVLPPEDASELAKMRAAQQHAQWRSQQQQQGQQANQVSVIGQTIGTWATTKQSSDPDFKPGTPLWDQVDLRIKSAPPYRTPQEAMAGSEKAYTDAKAFLSKLQPRTAPNVKKALQSRSNSTNNNVIMKTAEDVMRAINAGTKPHQMRYS